MLQINSRYCRLEMNSRQWLNILPYICVCKNERNKGQIYQRENIYPIYVNLPLTYIDASIKEPKYFIHAWMEFMPADIKTVLLAYSIRKLKPIFSIYMNT